MGTERFVVELVVPAVDLMQVLEAVESGLAVSMVVMLGSVSSYLFVCKISDEAIDAMGGFMFLPFLWSLHYWIVRSLVNRYLDVVVVDQDRFDELESKAASLEDFFGVDDNE